MSNWVVEEKSAKLNLNISKVSKYIDRYYEYAGQY